MNILDYHTPSLVYHSRDSYFKRNRTPQEWESGNYTVEVERETYVDEVILSLLVKYRADTAPVVWASQPLLGLQQSITTPPMLFVQVSATYAFSLSSVH